MLERGLQIWTHEDFKYDGDDLAALFQSFFGATFTERNFDFRQVTMFRHDLGRVWLTTHLSLLGPPVFRVRWEAPRNRAPNGIPSQALSFGEVRKVDRTLMAIPDLDSAFVDAVNCLASFSRVQAYRLIPGEKIRLPQLAMRNISTPALVSLLRNVSCLRKEDKLC